MFDKLEIKNFQSIKNISLDLGRVTVISGPSNIGKSAICRAIDTLVHNNFNNSFMTDGARDCTIKLSEGENWVSFHRGKSSSYSLSTKTKPFTKIGRDVPEDVKDFLNMSKIKFDTDLEMDFNFQKQFDAPFLISNSGFEIAKVFGKIMNLELVMAASREINKDVLAKQKRLDVLKEIQKEDEEFIKNKSFIEKQHFFLQEANLIQERRKELKAKYVELIDLINNIQNLQLKIEVLQKEQKELQEYKLLENIDDLENIVLQYENALAKRTVLNEVYQSSVYKEIEVSDISETLKAYEEIEAKKLAYEEVSSNLSSFKELPISVELVSVIQQGNMLNSDFVMYKKKALELKETYTQTLSEFENFLKDEGICPITKMKFSPQCIERLKNENTNNI